MRFLVLTLLGLTALSTPVMAQEKENQIHLRGSTFKNPAVDEIRRLQKESREKNDFVKPSTIEVSVVKYDFMDEDQFGILMAVPDVVSGCFDISPLQYEATFIDPYYLDIRVKDYLRKTVESDNVASGCAAGNKMATALMVLSRSDMQRREIRQVRFSNGMVSDYYDIAWGDKTLSLKPQSMVVFKAKNLEGDMKDHIALGFDDSTRIALHVPMAKAGEDVKAAITKFASQNGLSPDTDNSESKDPSGAPVFYFNDVSGRFMSQIGEDGHAQVGQITVGRPYDGPNGRQMTGVPLTVFATKPGTSL
jgi:hypothetical protein